MAKILKTHRNTKAGRRIDPADVDYAILGATLLLISAVDCARVRSAEEGVYIADPLTAVTVKELKRLLNKGSHHGLIVPRLQNNFKEKLRAFYAKRERNQRKFNLVEEWKAIKPIGELAFGEISRSKERELTAPLDEEDPIGHLEVARSRLKYVFGVSGRTTENRAKGRNSNKSLAPAIDPFAGLSLVLGTLLGVFDSAEGCALHLRSGTMQNARSLTESAHVVHMRIIRRKLLNHSAYAKSK